MKDVYVVGAAIMKDGKLFVAQRPDKGEVGLKWEYPGGKIEDGETPVQAIIREIKEELNADIEVESYITTVRYQYTTFHLTMELYLCRLKGSDPVLNEHINSRWITSSEMDGLDWAPADTKIINEVRKACF